MIKDIITGHFIANDDSSFILKSTEKKKMVKSLFFRGMFG